MNQLPVINGVEAISCSPSYGSGFSDLIIALKRLSEAHGFQIKLAAAVEAMRDMLNEIEMKAESAGNASMNFAANYHVRLPMAAVCAYTRPDRISSFKPSSPISLPTRIRRLSCLSPKLPSKPRQMSLRRAGAALTRLEATTDPVLLPGFRKLVRKWREEVALFQTRQRYRALIKSGDRAGAAAAWFEFRAWTKSTRPESV